MHRDEKVTIVSARLSGLSYSDAPTLLFPATTPRPKFHLQFCVESFSTSTKSAVASSRALFHLTWLRVQRRDTDKSTAMVSRELYKVHSLKTHIANAKNGTKAYTNRTTQRPTIKSEPATNLANLFPDQDDDDDDNDSASDSSDDGGSNFLSKLGPMTNGTAASKRRSKDDEIADSDVERQSSSGKKRSAGSGVSVKPEPESSEAESEAEEAEPEVTANGDIKAEASDANESSSSSSDEDSSSEESSSEDSGSEEEDENEDEGEKGDETAKVVEEPNTAKSDAEESDAESEAEAPAKAQPAVNGISTSGTTSKGSDEESTNDEDEDEDEEEEREEQTQAPAKENRAAPEESSSSEAESESESESESQEDQDMADESMHISDREDGNQAVPKFIAPDFTLRKSQEGLNGQDVAQICNQANLDGKQLWYFTVPSNVPVSVVQNLEIPMDQPQRGDSIFSHNGEVYGFSFDTVTPKSTIQILIPSTDSPQYRSCKSSLTVCVWALC